MTERSIQLLICKPSDYRNDMADPACGWVESWYSQNYVSREKESNGDIFKTKCVFNAVNGWHFLVDAGPQVNPNTHPYVIMRYRINRADCRVVMKFVQDIGGIEVYGWWILDPPSTDWTIAAVKYTELTGKNPFTGNYIDKIHVGFDLNEAVAEYILEIDFILFTSINPFYTDEDLGDVFDVPRCNIGVNDKTDFLSLVVENFEGKNKTRFAYRDEAYLWVKKNGDFQRIFGGYIESIDPESVQHGREYLTLNALGWSALLYERLSVEAYEDEDADDVVKDIIDKADKQAALGFTTFGVKDVQKKVDILKCDYDTPLSKLVEMCDDLDLCFHMEPNRDASLYPKGKRFLRYAGWMEDSWEKGWACTSQFFETDSDIAQMKTGSSGGTGTLYRVTVFSVDSTVFKKLLLELKGSDIDTQYSVKVVIEDDAEYTVEALTAAPTSYTVKEWDLTSIITGANKNVKDVKLGISKAGSQGILYFKWLGFFPVTPPYEKITLDAATNVRAGAFLREPKKARNMVIVKGDKFTYNVPIDADEWTKEPAPTIIEEDNESFWSPDAWGTGGTLALPVISGDTTQKIAGIKSTKIVIGSGSYTNWGIKHDYPSGQDWSLKHYIFFWWQGQNTGDVVGFYLYTTVPSDWIGFTFQDNFSGWKLFIFNLDDPSVQGGQFNRGNINRVAIEGHVQGTFRIDEVVLSISRFCWGAEHCTLSNDQDSKAGIYALKAEFEAGVVSDFKRQSSGFILQDPFDTLDLTKYDKGAHGGGEGDSYVEAGELINKIRYITSSYRRYIVTKDLKQLNGMVIEVKIISSGLNPATSNRFILSTTHTTNGDPTATDHVQVASYLDWAQTQNKWLVEERDYPNDPVRHYDGPLTADNTKAAKIIMTENNVKVYLDDELVCNKARILSFTDAYIYLYGSTSNTSFQYPKQDNLKIYKDTKIYVEGLSPNWKVELWSGTNASPGSKQAEATVPAGSTVAELDVLTLVFPFTGFFKVFKPDNILDHTSPDYSDIWGGDRYLAKQTSAAMEHKVIFPKTKDLKINAVELKKLKFWFKHSSGDVAETARLILATDDDNYYYTNFSPVNKWKELFEFDVGWIQNILFENVGTPSLKNLNYIAFLYPATSAVEWVMIDEFRFEGETEAWGIARDESCISDIRLQPEKIFSSYYKTQEDAQDAAEYFLSILKNPPLVKGSLTHPWGLPQLRAGDTIIANVPNENINNEEMIVKEVIHVIPPASSKLTTEISLAGVPHALTDPQKRLKEHIERLTKADVYAENVEILAMPLKENLQITDVLKAELETILTDDMSITDIIEALIEALLSETMTITDDLKADIEVPVSDNMSISDYHELLEQILAADNLSISDYMEALIEALLSDNMNISDYLQARWIWEDFNNLTNWTAETGTWSADGVAHQTDTTTGGKRLKYTGGNVFLANYFVEIRFKHLLNEQCQCSTFPRYVDRSNSYQVMSQANVDKVYLYRGVGGSWTLLAEAAKTIGLDTWYKMKVDQRDEGANWRCKVYWQDETSPCINYLESPRTYNNAGSAVIEGYNAVAGPKQDFDYFYLWTE